MRKIFYVTFLLFLALQGVAQDSQLTQFYAAPLYLNPAMAGSTKLTKATLLYRNQWPSLSSNFVTYSASIDQSFPRFSSGLGLAVFKDQIGEATDFTTLSGSYSFYFNLSTKVEVRLGIQGGYTIGKIDPSKLIFGDQLDASAPSSLFGSQDAILAPDGKTDYFDFAGGAEIHNSVYSLGISAFHLNNPVSSFTGTNNRIPIRFNIHGGARLSLKDSKIYRPLYRLLYNVVKKEVYINPEFLLKRQGNFTQLDVGVDIHYDIFMFGVWNRGIPFASRKNVVSRDAVALLVGYSQHGFTAAYSYDITISSQTATTGGAHELSIIYLFDLTIDRKKPLKRHRIIPCPQF